MAKRNLHKNSSEKMLLTVLVLVVLVAGIIMTTIITQKSQSPAVGATFTESAQNAAGGCSSYTAQGRKVCISKYSLQKNGVSYGCVWRADGTCKDGGKACSVYVPPKTCTVYQNPDWIRDCEYSPLTHGHFECIMGANSYDNYKNNNRAVYCCDQGYKQVANRICVPD